MDNIIEVLFVIPIFLVVLICCFNCCKEAKKNSGNQVENRIQQEIYSTTHQETPTDPVNSSSIQQNSQQSLRIHVLPEVILTPSHQVINPECDSPLSYESLFTCECSGRPSPNSGGSNLNLTFDSGWSIVDSVNWVFRKIEDSFIWIFDQMDQHM